MKLKSLLAAAAIAGLAVSPIQAAAVENVRTAAPVAGEGLAGTSEGLVVAGFIAALIGLVVVATVVDDDDEDLPASP